mmetsp:Transcript_32702/g.56892  ORF Transcript_32702/g.56892 Transcript_32702/m.56892 type:complete len:362 (-) Transcript_32702:21-1106(-)
MRSSRCCRVLSSNSSIMMYQAQPDIPLVPPPGDTVQCLKFSPHPSSSFIAACGWDGKASVWEIGPNEQVMPKAQVSQPDPILGLSWKIDCSSIFLAGTDNQVKLWDLATSNVRQVGAHQAPVRDVAWCEQIGCVISGGWDNAIRFWDTRQSTPVASIQLSGKVYGMSFNYPLLVAILSDRQMAVINVNAVTQGNLNPTIVPDTTIKYQIRSVATSTDAKTIVLGMIEGRCICKNVSLEPTITVSQDFTFRCHRDTLAHSLNCLAYSPQHSSFATGGSDSQILLWDKVAKQRLKCYASLGGPVTAVDFRHDSALLGYAIGYDWHKGYEHANSVQPKICLRKIGEDAKPKATTGTYSSYGYRR